mmetsp:Transcript_7752/g.18254  ORF Transcript_7752/g.18254 Transcript_7752/m.18254 type:complete len:214 (+) Transcript_7752:150-791(+)
MHSGSLWPSPRRARGAYQERGGQLGVGRGDHFRCDVVGQQGMPLLLCPDFGDGLDLRVNGKSVLVERQRDGPDPVPIRSGYLARTPDPGEHTPNEQDHHVRGVGTDDVKEVLEVIQFVGIEEDGAPAVNLHQHLDLPGKHASSSLVVAEEGAELPRSPQAPVDAQSEEAERRSQHAQRAKRDVPTDGQQGATSINRRPSAHDGHDQHSVQHER